VIQLSKIINLKNIEIQKKQIIKYNKVLIIKNTIILLDQLPYFFYLLPFEDKKMIIFHWVIIFLYHLPKNFKLRLELKKEIW